MDDPAHRMYLAEQITRLVLYVAALVASLYFGFRKKRPPK
jgi:hypothetical protein